MKFFAQFMVSLVLLVGISNSGYAQKKAFIEEPTAFVQEFVAKVASHQGEASKKVEPGFSSLWNAATLSLEQKMAFIQLANDMAQNQVPMSPTIANFARAFVLVNQGNTYVTIEPNAFLEVTKQCVQQISPKRLNKYFLALLEYLPSGYTSSHRKFSWRASESFPKLEFITIGTGEKRYSAPVIRFEETKLVYGSQRDSSTISKTSGDFNLISRTFRGKGGMVDWSKLGLSTDDVFCVFKDFKLNFNYGLIEADSVEFYYKSLIDEPLVGKFIDKNAGFKNVNTANYPVFRSYEGGVVIENFIPNVRYEGGFMLKGTRKIGSAYDVYVDYKPDYSGDPELSYGVDEFYYDEKNEDEFDEFSSDEWTSNSNEEWDSEDEGFEAFSDDYGFNEMGKIKTRIKANLQIKRNDTYVMKLLSESFVLDQEKLVGKGVEATIYVTEEDSLYHPSMDLRYTVADQTVTLFKPKKGTAKSIPFTSSYHKYFLYFEAIIWKLDTDDIKFTAFIDRENKVYAIESFDYFTKARFNQFRNLLKFNPIGGIYRYALTHKGEAIFPEDIVKEYKLMDQLTTLERSLPALEGSGFISYNKVTKEITPLDKLFLWARAARGKKDFDAIQVISKVDTGAHAVMNIQSQDIKMNGVPYFSLSDSQYVKVFPLEGEVLVQENRNLLFAGAVAGGKLNFYANDEDNRPRFTFDYDAFNIHCDSLDSIRFVLVRNPVPGYEPSPLELALGNTVFENITGTLHLDDPRNKSGKETNPEYPIFDSHSSSYLFWDNPSIQNGVYEKDKFYFSVTPFVLDSLDNFDNQGLKFEGEFFSSEITPKFDQTLTVMPDFTLGFIKKTEVEDTEEEDAMDMYNYRGKLFGEMILDGSGLHGRGKLEHLDAVVVSDSFIFHFDSVMAVVDNFNMPGSYRNPKVESGQAVYKWYTKLERIALETTNNEPINVYDGKADFEGRLFLSRNGLVGDGSLTIGSVKISGDSIVFRERYFKAENSEFAIIDSVDKEKVHFVAKDVNIDYDLFRRSSRFESKGPKKTLADFPGHQFLTSLTKGEFDVERNILSLRGYGGSPESNFFLSSKVPNDSLRLVARTATYDHNTQKIVINDVPPIKVADALITPEIDDLTILSDGSVGLLENAVIEANRETKFHKIYEAQVELLSQSQYKGSGKYDYIQVNGKDQYIEFEEILVNEETISFATGEIKESQKFYLTDRIFFRGKATLNASEKFLTFEGHVKIESENPIFKGQWFTFEKTVVNPDSVFIPIRESLTNTGGDLLTAGLHFAPYDKVFYSNFLQAKDDDNDIDIVTASGGLTLDRKTQEFKIASEDKIKGKTFKGSMVSFSDVENVITSQGRLNFDYGFREKTIGMKMAGSWRDDIENRSLSTNLLIGIDFALIPEAALDELVKTLRFFVSSNKDIDFHERSIVESISELLDEGKNSDKETRKFLKDRDNAMVYSDIHLAERLQNTLSLSHVNFDYSRDQKALFCDGSIGLIGVGGKTINKMIDAKIVYEFGGESPTGEVESDKLTIYLEVGDEYNWIYFHYEEDVIKTVSAYEEYNTPIEDEVSKKGADVSGFHLELATEDEKAEFLENFIIKFIKGKK